jgi:predicted ATPase
MIKQIKVSGFKSLVNFNLELKPGLNILVGPNGSGKTNIIAFFEFLGHLQEMNVPNAISTAGGAGAVLTKTGENTYRSDLSATVSGTMQARSRQYIYYEYRFDIAMYPRADRITYKRQRVRIKYRTVGTMPNKEIDDYDLDIERLSDEKMNIICNVNNINEKKVHGRYHRFRPRDVEKKEIYINRIKKLFEDPADMDHSIITILRFLFDDSYLIMNDLRGGPVFNIEPSKARIPEDSAKPPGIRKDGSGIYATLYAMKQNEEGKRTRRSSPFFYYRDDYTLIGDTKLSQVVNYVRLANESIKEIDVTNNPFDNQLQVRVVVSGQKSDAVLPLGAMSDGTIKWVALVTILFTNRTVFSIEEPENYLHPLMQSEILNIMRSTNIGRSILMSTHSETLLNSATPEEIIVVSFAKGKTKAHRPTNSDDVRKEIQQTGFGLGYYYLAGSLENG